VPTWARVVVSIAALRVAAALAVFFSGLAPPSAGAQVPLVVYIALLVAFTSLGLTLIASNRNDVRASWLGAVLVMIVVPLTGVFVRPAILGVLAQIDAIRPDAFLAAALWRFAAEFPTIMAGRKRAIVLGIATVATLIGAVFAAVNLSLLVVPASREVLDWRAAFLTWNGVGSVYWPVLFLLSAGALIVLITRLFASTGEDRVRTRIFVTGLAIGILPFFLEVLAEESFAPYKAWVHSAAIEPIAATILFGAFATVPFLTAYSVIYDRVVDTRFLVRAAIQYALAKYTIIIVTAIPLAALVLYLNAHSNERLADLLAGRRALFLMAALALGIAAVRGRDAVLRSVDRRFFREVHDTQLLVASLISDEALARPPAAIAAHLREVIDNTLHARADLYVIDDDDVLLRDPEAQHAPLSATSTFLALALADAHPMDVDTATPLLSRLPYLERAWLEAGQYRLVMALKLRSGAPAGLLALTAKRSELPFSDNERRSLNALATPLSLAIENDRLRRAPEAASEAPASECTACSRLHARGAPQCSCGGALTEASAPHLLRGVFRFEQRIGAGGMGVVYRATDIHLGREVAIKTLPRVTPDHAAQLKREAQAMASVVHPNLAVIYGIESWRGTPFLVQEYLAGGMLSHRLRGGPLPIVEALDLGISLSQVLAQLHASGIVHCDIKPSNIGFSSTGIVKLVDFGLAYLLRDAGAMATTATRSSDSPELNVIVTARGLMGTPAYMSPEASLAARPSPGFDLWGLSVVLFELVAGKRPFTAATPDELFHVINTGTRPDVRTCRPECPPELAQFLDDAIAIDPRRRPGTAHELAARLTVLRSTAA